MFLKSTRHKHSVFCHFLEIHGHSLESDPDTVFNCLSVYLRVSVF